MDDGRCTHCVVGRNYDESLVQEARELYEKPTITEQWVLVSAKLGKLAPVKPYDPITNGKLFSNFIFTMYQIEAQDRLKLYAMVTLHGGSVQKELDNKVTHLLSGGSQSVAIKVAALTKNKLTIITPDWVLECLRQKKLVDPDVYHPNLLITAMQQTSKITLMPTGVREEKSAAMVRSQLQQNVRQSRPIIQTMQHTPQQINEIIQSQIQQQQMQEKAKQRAAAASTHGPPIQTSQSPVTTLSLGSSDLAPQNPGSMTQISQKISPQQVLSGNSQVPMSSNHSNNMQQQQALPPQVQINPNPMASNNQISMQRQISLQQIEANARQQKIQMISQQLQQSTQNQQQIIAQQQFKQQYQNNQMMGNAQQAVNPVVSHMGQNIQQGQQQQQQLSLQQQQQQPQQQFTPINQSGNVQQQAQTPTAQHQQQQQFAGQPMKQIITPNQAQNQQFMLNQNPAGGTVKTGGPQSGGNNGSNNYIQIIQQGQQIIQIQHPEGGQMQQKVLHVS